MREHGANAYATARAAVRKARRRGNVRLVTFMEKVSLEVVRQQGRKVEVETATLLDAQ